MTSQKYEALRYRTIPSEIYSAILLENTCRFDRRLPCHRRSFSEHVCAGSAGDLSPEAGLKNQVVATIPVGNGAHGIVVSPDDAYVYVGNENDNTVSKIEVASGSVVGTYPAGSNPDAIAITPNGDYLYVANYVNAGTVTVLNTATGALVKQIAVDEEPRYLAISPDGKVVYVPNQASGTVSVIDTSSQTVTGSITIGSNASGVWFAPDGDEAYVSDDNQNIVYTIDTKSLKMVGSGVTVTDPVFLTVNPKGKHDIYVQCYGAQNVSVIGGKKVLKTIDLNGASPGFPGVTPNGKYLYVPLSFTDNGTVPDNQILVFSTSSFKQVGSPITVGEQANWMAFNHKGTFAYETNFSSNTVSVIQITPAQK
jgi:YVTN family beta-propeller protein